MERDYGLLSKFVKEDEKREKMKKTQDDTEMRSKVDALKKMIEKFKLPDSIKLDLEGENNDSLKLKEGMREYNRKKEVLDKIKNRER